MSTKQVIHIDDSGIATETIVAFTGVSVSGNSVSIAAGNVAVDGIALNDAQVGEPVHYAEQGLTVGKVAVAAGITAGTIVTTNDTGGLIALSGGGNSGNIVALQAGGADGNLISIYFDAYNLSNTTVGA